MPIINIPSRNVQLNFPDTMSDEEIQSAIDKEYPRNGEDVALEIDQVKNAALEGQDLVNPFDQMSNDDYVLYRKHLADKKTSFGDAIGIAKDTFTNIIDEVGTGIGATAYKLSQGEIGNVAESAGAGMVAGTIGLTDIAGKILNPAQPIPSKEDFIGKRTTRLVDNPNFPNAYPMEVEDITTEEDYNKLIEAEKQRDAGVVNNLYAMELTMRGAPIEEVSRGFQYVDPTLLAGAGGALVKSAGKTLFTKGAARTALGTAGTVGTSTAPSALGRAGLSAVEGTAGAVESVASLPSKALQGVGQIAESVAPGSGVGAQATALTASAMGDLGLTAGVVGGAKATEKVAEVVGAAANAARQEASRAGLLEQVALNSAVSPAGRKLAAGLAQLQPVGRAALDLTKGAVKGAAAGSVVGGVLGGLAERNLEGVAAGFGAGGALGGITGAFHGAFDLGKEALGGSTSRTRQQATGDINTFISTRPEIEQGAWSDTMSKLVAKVGPERAASQLDAMRVAEASGGKIRVATPDEIKQGLAPGWVNIEGMEIVLNPEKILADTAAHESAHVLFNSVINRAFRPEIEAAIYGVADPVTGQIVKAGVFDDIALGKVAEQIRDAYGKNTVAANEFQGFANTLKNSTDADSLANARSRIADEMTAAYTGRLFERTRAGRFNPDRLPLVYRKVLSAIEDGVLDKFRSAIFEKGMDLGFDNVAKTFKDKNGKPIRIPELDAIVKKAFAQKLKTVDVANAKPDLIPVKPADRILWAKTYGGAKGVLNDDGTPKSQAQIDAEATARWQDMTMRLSALPDNEKIGIDFARDKAGKTVMTAKGQLSPTAINAILDSGALDPSAKAVLVEVLNSMQRADKSTFDTRYYGVYTRGKGGNKMVAGVKSASQNEILPYSVEINSKDGVLIRAVDMSKVRDRLATAMNKPQFKDAYSNPVDALKDLRKYMDNITQINAVDSATLLGGGVKGATKRNLFYEALGFRLRNGETLLNAPDSVVNKSQNTIKSYRAERFAKLVDSGNKFAFEEATTYERALRNFQPDAFTPESLPNGESFTNPDGYRILNKAGSKLFRTYDDTGKLIGIAESKEKAMKKAQDEFAKKAMKEEPANIRFQFAGEAAEMPKFMRDSLETAKAMAKEGKDSETMRAITGWFPGKYDDKMRWEVPDQMSVLKGTVKAYELVSRAWKSVTQPRQPDAPTAQLQDILRHPSLFSAYPEAATIPIVADVNLSSSGAIGPMSGFEGNVIQVNGNLSGDRLRSTLLHEVQHWIQDKEGFARGSSPAGVSKYDFEALQAENTKYAKAMRDLIEEHKAKGGSSNTARQTEYGKVLSDSLIKIQDAIKEAEKDYRRTAGEIESRDVQARQSFTPEQRKAIAPYSSENIAKEEAIVLKSTSKSPTEMRFQPVTPEQDAAFLAAAKAGDTETAQRLVDEVVKEAGGIEFEHTSNTVSNLKDLDVSKTSPNSTLGKAIYATLKSGSWKPAHLSTGNTLKGFVFGNVLDMTNPTSKDLNRFSQIIGRELEHIPLISLEKRFGSIDKGIKKAGYDAAIHMGPGSTGKHIAIFNTDQIKSADPITYDDAGNIIPLSQRFNQASPDIRFQPSSITARDINTIAKEVGGGEVKGGAKKFGAFMREMRDKGVTIRDVVKSYGITLSSIQRQELLAQTIKKNWPDAPFEDGVKIRPEDAFATLLGTEEGQSYLNAAEKGEFNEAAVDVMMQKFKSFGFQNKLKEQMKVAAEEFFPKAESIIDAVNNMPADQFAEFVRSNVRGISYGKIGFWSGQLGRGDIPTFDSRMGKLVYGKEVPVSNKVLMGQKERLPMLGITVPDEYKDFAQTLLHHEVWDRLNNSDTEHAPIKEAMLRFQPDPVSPNILNGSDGSRIIKSTSGKYRVYFATGALAGVKDTLESAQKLVQAKSNK